MELREKLILEEPDDEKTLPDAIPAEPIVVSTEVEGTSDAEVPEEIETNAYSSLLMDEISNAYDSINSANSLIATFADDEKYADVVEILNDIVDKRTLIIGELHTALSIVDPETGGLIYDGMGDLKQQDDAFDGPLDESADAKYEIVKTNSWYDPEGLYIPDDRRNVVFEGTKEQCDAKLLELHKELEDEYADRDDITVSIEEERRRNPDTGEIYSMGRNFIEVYYMSAIAKEFYRIVEKRNESIVEKVTRSDRRIAKSVNKHLTEKDAKDRFRLFIYEVDPKTFAKVKDTEQNMGDFDTKKEAEEQGEATVKSWNVNNAGVRYGYVVRGAIG